jgi:pimeloyl-ACP methyl ester carboxylesterase
MNERALLFGDTRNLVGILTEPDPDRMSPDRPGIILLNSGILHRAGASRLYVKIARRLGASGFTAFRFDHSGIGDSEARRDDRTFLESSIHEARAAMDLLQTSRGVQRFILAGLCSGSDMAYWTALEDDRVVGLAQLDPFVYRTRKFMVRYYLPRLLSPVAWWRSALARTRGLAARLRPATEDDEARSVWVDPEYTRIFPPRTEVEQGLKRLAERRVAFFAFISGDMGAHINYAQQYRESFPDVEFGSQLTVDFAPGADHTVTGLPYQEQVVTGIDEWARTRWPADPVVRPPAAAPDPGRTPVGV